MKAQSWYSQIGAARIRPSHRAIFRFRMKVSVVPSCTNGQVHPDRQVHCQSPWRRVPHEVTVRALDELQRPAGKEPSGDEPEQDPEAGLEQPVTQLPEVLKERHRAVGGPLELVLGARRLNIFTSGC